MLVFMDRATRKSKPISEKLLAWLKENGATPIEVAKPPAPFDFAQGEDGGWRGIDK